ncbi:MAGUK p55 subfamily member 7 isoform X2 [Aricia agestis]|uniref:MAGUK p55 subfamily member 7 isoform X2 n=1 Tax=Aricia agestis TaxID=91739 RepID=UPI001C201F31|nr:MAGUK p55 subfamily member 7 isoform X2 [Aricia agestis]
METSTENWDPALTRLLSSLKEVQSNGEDVAFLNELLQSKQLHALVQVHNKIVAAQCKDDKFYPLLSNAMQVTLEVLEMFGEVVIASKEYQELLSLLQKPHFQAILCTHDAVAQKDYYPHLPDIPQDADEEEETVKIVQLVKSDEPLGATIKTDEETGKIVIARVMHGGAADRSGLIHAGDEVIEVNGISVENKTPADVLTILQNSEGTITFKLVPSFGKGGSRESKVRVRALFNYNPAEDPYIPCKEAGLSFKKGDILHIVSQDDAYWWQARREGDRIMRAGLIPSRALQEGRILHDRQTDPQTLDGKPALCSPSTANTDCAPKTPCSPTPNATALLPCKSTPKVKKIIYDIKENDDFDREMVPTYEEVARLYPRPGFVRPIVLVGAPGVGRNELRRRLIATDPEKYVTPVPYTSRAQKPSEQSGKEYVFVTREKMEQDISDGKFIEHGEYKGNLYGTSAESVETIVNTGRVCVLSPHWQALKMLRTPRLRPYIVFIKPPPLEKLVDTRTAANARSTFDKESSRAFTEEEFNDIIRSSNRINFLYGYMFDEEIVNEDLARALTQLLKMAWKVQSEPLWVPASWVQ